MAKKKAKEEPKPKTRSKKYEEKVHYEGTLEDMINMAIKPESKKKK